MAGPEQPQNKENAEQPAQPTPENAMEQSRIDAVKAKHPETPLELGQKTGTERKESKEKTEKVNAMVKQVLKNACEQTLTEIKSKNYPKTGTADEVANIKKNILDALQKNGQDWLNKLTKTYDFPGIRYVDLGFEPVNISDPDYSSFNVWAKKENGKLTAVASFMPNSEPNIE